MKFLRHVHVRQIQAPGLFLNLFKLFPAFVTYRAMFQFIWSSADPYTWITSNTVFRWRIHRIVPSRVMRLEGSPIRSGARTNLKKKKKEKKNQRTRFRCTSVFQARRGSNYIPCGPPKFYPGLVKLVAYSLRVVLARLLRAGHIVGRVSARTCRRAAHVCFTETKRVGQLSSAIARKGQPLPELFHGDTRLKGQLLGRLATRAK